MGWKAGRNFTGRALPLPLYLISLPFHFLVWHPTTPTHQEEKEGKRDEAGGPRCRAEFEFETARAARSRLLQRNDTKNLIS